MANLSAPCFSPPPSEPDDRATSPALSSSSRTTTSIPTDVSDISSLDGDDYEVIDGPVPLHDGDHQTGDHTDVSQLRGRYDASVASEIDGSSFIAPYPYQHDEYDEVAWRGESSLHASTSLATLSLEPDLLESQASSQLRFPDPMDDSFLGEELNTLSSKAVQCSDAEDNQSDVGLGVVHAGEAPTPRLSQMENPVAKRGHVADQYSGKTESTADKAAPIPGPVGTPFNWNKKLIMANVLRAVMGLIVILLTTGVLPVWPGSTAVPKQAALSCNSRSTSWLESLLGYPPPCSPATAPSNALMLPPSNASGVIGSMTSFMSRPTVKAIRPSIQSKQVSVTRRECNALSLYMAEVRTPSRGESIEMWDTSRCSHLLAAHMPICLDYVDGAAVCHSTRKTTRSKGRAAKKNAMIIATSARKKWQVYVEELNAWLRNMTYTISKAIRQQSLAFKQRTAKEDPWGKAWNQFFQLMAILQRSWSEMMRDVHSIYLQVMAMFRDESTNFKKDAEAGYQYARAAVDVQYKQAIFAARQVRKTIATDMKFAQKNLAKRAKGARKSWIKAWEEVSKSESVHRLQRDAVAAREQVVKKVTAKKEALRTAAVNMKQAQIKRAARKRVAEVHQLRAKHREMMALVRKQNKIKHRAERLINKGKLAVYRKAIQSVQARHQVENMLGKMASGGGKLKAPLSKGAHHKKGKKSRAKKAASGVPR